MICFSAARSNDSQFLKQVELPKGSIIIFDKGYPDYNSYNRFTENKITWVTRLRNNASYIDESDRQVMLSQKEAGVIRDVNITLRHNHSKDAVKVPARLVVYKDAETGRVFEFITNNFKMNPSTIAALYKKRWQIELLFKRIKQNFPLQYFLGDSENAIKIQIWCVLIADLLLKVIKKTTKCKWSFSNLASMIRLHLMTYIDLAVFVNNAEKVLLQRASIRQQLTPPSLFDP